MFRWFVALLICLVASTIAVDTSASILLPKTFEFSAEDAVHAIEVSALAQLEPKSSQGSSSQQTTPSPSTPLPPLNKIQRLAFFAFAATQGSGNSSSTTSGGTSSPGSGSGVPAIASTSDLQFDSGLVGWLSQSNWLDIPISFCIDLLRPPQYLYSSVV